MMKSLQSLLLCCISATVALSCLGCHVSQLQRGRTSNDVNQKNSGTGFESITMPSGIRLVKIPGGSFLMGKEGPVSEPPVHRVTISTFYMGQYEVTNAEFDRFKKLKRHAHSPGDNQPVVTASYQDALDYAAWLSKQDGVQYSLPTEAQWEYAARDGREGFDYPWGNRVTEQQARIGGMETMPVGSYPPTSWGLYDIIGNVGEMTQDSYAEYTPATRVDPRVQKDDKTYVSRGQGIRSYLPHLWLRTIGMKDIVVFTEGFRLVCKQLSAGTKGRS
jgi:formylglycine-generating enzyme required for sulfatase activity